MYSLYVVYSASMPDDDDDNNNNNNTCVDAERCVCVLCAIIIMCIEPNRDRVDRLESRLFLYLFSLLRAKNDRFVRVSFFIRLRMLHTGRCARISICVFLVCW